MKKLIIASLIGLLSGCVDNTNEFYVQTCSKSKSIGPELRIIVKDKTVAVFNDQGSIVMEYAEFDNCKIVNSKNWSCYQTEKELKKLVEATGDKYDSDLDIKVLRMQNGFMFINNGFLKIDYYTVFENAEYGFSGWRYWGYKIGLGLPKLPFAICS